MKALWRITYDIVTPESAEDGDTAESGFISDGETLRDAISDLFSGRTSAADSGQGIENSSRWFSYYHGMEFETGAYETRALHPPEGITPASYGRLARLLGAL